MQPSHPANFGENPAIASGDFSGKIAKGELQV
jgi:hypothetical protein